MTVSSYSEWHTPFLRDEITLDNALDSLQQVKAEQHEVPLMVQLVENPRYRIPGFEIFHGRVDLQQHDFIHILLGRGLLSMDEAFTIGFTMGSTNKISTTEEQLFSFISRYFYPQVYQFSDDDIAVFRNALRLGYISGCEPLDEFDFTAYRDERLRDLRVRTGVESDLLMAYYRIEKQRYPLSDASQRLLDE